LLALLLWEVVRVARPGASGPELAGEVRRSDLQLVGYGVFAAAVAFLVLAAAGNVALGGVLFEVGMGLAIAAPWALRMLGIVLPEFLVMVALLGATGAVFAGHAFVVSAADARYLPVVHFFAICTVAFVLSNGQTWLRAWISRIVLRRTLRQQAELQAFLATLSPELGTLECCRRMLAELVRVRQLRGAAIILRDGEAVVHGSALLSSVSCPSRSARR
jgi:hypothetical protein